MEDDSAPNVTSEERKASSSRLDQDGDADESHDDDDALNDDVDDMEDCCWDEIHKAACKAGRLTYTDPLTGYTVFTELAHQARGTCCGSGCRHCPFAAHENVVVKQEQAEPTFLYRATNDNLFYINKNEESKKIRVLFFSGGKDSFLAIRAMVRERSRRSTITAADDDEEFGLVLLTTFDASSRKIAHQDVSVDDTVIRQAQHLNISLLGIPLHRRAAGASKKSNKDQQENDGDSSYVQRIRLGLQLIEQEYHPHAKISALVFGDLHLEHIRKWRQEQLGSYDCELLYPLFGMPYDRLEQDLWASQVPCLVSSSNVVDVIRVGEMYTDPRVRQRLLLASDIDLFGENGEFHTVAQVWLVDRSVALGLNSNEAERS